MQYTVFDIESNGLLDSVTRIHCLSYTKYNNREEVGKGSITGYSEIQDFLLTQEVLVGHNIVRYDIPVLEMLLNLELSGIRLIDTLALSWYLWPFKLKHGLEQWGDDLGVQKPHIVDWSNLSIGDYIYRCETDVKINSLLFHKQMSYLMQIYDGDTTQINNLINYLVFKLDCAKEQEAVKCKIDSPLVSKSLNELYALREEKVAALVATMPKNIKYKEVSKPKKLERKDGSLSTLGNKWYALLESLNLPQSHEEVIMIKVSEEDGNPSSSGQLKDWLFSLGWEPVTFEFRKSTKGEVNKVPQIYVDDQVCDSIKELYDTEPALENLDMLSLINHRIGIFNSFEAKMDEDSYVKAEVAGFTNTLRFKHMKPIVNLPSKYKFYGDKIRGSLIAPDEDSILCGSDMSSLEDSTKQHYMYFFDPDYVTQMRVPGFDPHIDIGVLAGMITQEEADYFKWYGKMKKDIDKGNTDYVFTQEEKERYFMISEKRGKSKTVNFAGVYGAGPPKIAQSTGMPLEQAQQLHKTYWDRNKAVKLVAGSCHVKTTNFDGEEQMWLLNPISKLYYSLRFEKDKFSTLNQGTGVYCFDLWVREVRSRGIKLMLQYHDEIAFPLKKDQQDWVANQLKEAIQAVNDMVKLNVPLGISVDFNVNYAEIH